MQGFDTETINGYARLISFFPTKLVRPVFSFEDILDLFFSIGGDFYAYNLDYDFSAVIKYLTSDEIVSIMQGLKVKHGKYEITYIKNKRVSILYRKKTVHFYDTYQFYLSSLRAASKKYLNLEKLDYPVNHLTDENLNDPRLWIYCLRDSELVYLLTKNFLSTLPKQLKQVKMFSPAFYSFKYFQSEIETNHVNKLVNDWFQRSYSGGWFEVFKRGHFKNVYYYDITSAYPDAIRKLKCLTDFIEVDEGGDYGSYEVLINDHNFDYGSAVLRHKGQLIRPVGRYRVWVSNFELKRFQERGIDYKILSAYQIKSLSSCRPFSRKINHLFPKRKASYIYKIVLNSLYGKFAQQIEKHKTCKTFYLDECMNFKDRFYETYIDGRVSNFVYAGFITGYTRNKIMDIVSKHFSSIIGVFTDCVISTKKLDLPLTDKIGDWKLEKWNELIMIGTGVYFFRMGKDWFFRMRGFDVEGKTAEEILHRVYDCKRGYLNLKISDRTSLTKAVGIGYLNELGNMIFNINKRLDLNFDHKRYWFENFRRGRDVFEKQVESLPLMMVK